MLSTNITNERILTTMFPSMSFKGGMFTHTYATNIALKRLFIAVISAIMYQKITPV